MEEGCADLLGIGGNGVERYIDISVHARARSIIKGDDIGVIVVLEELSIDGQDFLVVAEYIIEFAHGVSVLSCGAFNPLLNLRKVNGRHVDVVSVEV